MLYKTNKFVQYYHLCGMFSTCHTHTHILIIALMSDIHCILNTNPSNIFCSVQRIATHPYTGEDEDELSFEKGDLISVIPFEIAQDEEV